MSAGRKNASLLHWNENAKTSRDGRVSWGEADKRSQGGSKSASGPAAGTCNQESCKRIDINLLNSLLSLAAREATLYLNTGLVPERSSAGIGYPSVGAPIDVYRSKDGYIVVAMMPIGKIAELIGVPGFEGNDSRIVLDNRDLIKRTLDRGFENKTTAELMEIFMQADIWAAPVNTLPQMEHDQQVEHNGTVSSFEHPKAIPYHRLSPSLLQSHAV